MDCVPAASALNLGSRFLDMISAAVVPWMAVLALTISRGLI